MFATPLSEVNPLACLKARQFLLIKLDPCLEVAQVFYPRSEVWRGVGSRSRSLASYPTPTKLSLATPSFAVRLIFIIKIHDFIIKISRTAKRPPLIKELKRTQEREIEKVETRRLCVFNWFILHRIILIKD